MTDWIGPPADADVLADVKAMIETLQADKGAQPWVIEAPSVQWAQDCDEYRGSLLTGAYRHWCCDWDGLPCDETCYEWPCCDYARERQAEDILLGGPGREDGEDILLRHHPHLRATVDDVLAILNGPVDVQRAGD